MLLLIYNLYNVNILSFHVKHKMNIINNIQKFQMSLSLYQMK